MPSFTVKVPRSSGPASFARRARIRAGLSSMYVRSNTKLPGPNIFKGLGAFFASVPTVYPGPNVFPSFAKRGMAAFRAQVSPTPIFPGRNVFTPFLASALNRPASCTKCSKYPRGMGQAYDDGSDATASLASLPQAPIFDVNSDLGGITVGPTPIAPVTTGTWQPGGSVTMPSSNPSLDAFNQALTNSQGAPGTVGSNLNAAQLAQLSNLVGSAVPSQLTTAATQVSSSALSSTLTSFLSQYGSYLLLGGVGIFAISLVSKKKGKR